MSKQRGRRIWPVFAGLILCVLVACSEDDLPNTPSEPFLFTSLRIGKNIQPVPLSTLTKGQAVSFNFQLAYTLSPQDAANRQNLRFFIDSGGLSPAGNFFSINPEPDVELQINAASGTVPVSYNLIIPAIDTLAAIDVFAAILDADGNFLARHQLFYGVQ